MNRLESTLLGQIKNRGDQVEGQRILVACSGGGDSMALLHLLLALRSSLNLELTVAHVDHRLRTESEEDRKFVQEESTRLNINFKYEEVAINQSHPGGVEMKAREARWSCLRAIASEQNCNWIATGHTLDDHTETVLMRLARGSGMRALTPLPACQSPRWSPLIQLKRSILRTYLSDNQIPWREDPTNELPFTPRNRWRKILGAIRDESPVFDEHLWIIHQQSQSTLSLAEAWILAQKPKCWDLDFSTKSVLFKGRIWDEIQISMILNLAFKELGYLRESRHLENLSRWLCHALDNQSEGHNGGYILRLSTNSEGMRLYKYEA